jgi:hypothetical protein
MMRLLRHFLAVAVAVVVLTVLAASSALAAETKTVYGLKDCNTSPSPPAPGGFCLITKSSFKILQGAKVYYTDAHVVDNVLKSPVTLRATDKQRSTAMGRCTFYIATNTGLCVYSSGTDKLAGFHATIVVGPTTKSNVYTLAGMYWFDRDGNDRD